MYIEGLISFGILVGIMYPSEVFVERKSPEYVVPIFEILTG